MSAQNFSFEMLDFDAVWEAIGRSTAMRATVEAIAKDVESAAGRLAVQEAYDQGFYSRLFYSGASSAAEVRRAFFQGKGSRRNRRRRGQEGTNRLLEGTAEVVKGDPQGSGYGGAVGWVVNTDFKALWVEYGSIAKGPRLILTRASEAVAKARGATFDRLYEKETAQNTAELGRRISAGKKNR